MFRYINRRFFIFIFSICIGLFLTLPSNCYGAYWSEDFYTHFSRDEPLREFLKAMAEDQGSHIVVSNKIKGGINSYYRNKRMSEIFLDIKSKFNLVTYLDGDILYVYSLGELQNKMIRMYRLPISHLEQELQNLGVLNDSIKKKIKWELNIKTNTVAFTAPPRFIEIAEASAQDIDKNFYIYKWRGEDNIIHYSNEPPFIGISYIKILKIETKDKGVVSTPLNKSIKTIEKVEEGK